MITAEEVVTRLEAAGHTLLCLPKDRAQGYARAATWLQVATCIDSEARADGKLRLVPSARAISDMDAVLRWLSLVDDDKYVLRRIVACRMLVSPATGRHMYSWRRIATLLGADHKAIQRWHGQGVAMIVRALNAPARRIAA